MSVNNFVLGACYPLGLLVQGTIADRTSLRAVTIGSGLVLAAILTLLFVRRPSCTDAIAALDRQRPPVHHEPKPVIS